MKIFALLLSVICGFAVPAWAAVPEYSVTIENHVFSPSEIRVPANQKVKLLIENKDATAEEFESRDLKREKLIAPKGKATLSVGPLKPGRYAFEGEFHAQTAQGVLIAE